ARPALPDARRHPGAAALGGARDPFAQAPRPASRARRAGFQTHPDFPAQPLARGRPAAPRPPYHARGSPAPALLRDADGNAAAGLHVVRERAGTREPGVPAFPVVAARRSLRVPRHAGAPQVSQERVMIVPISAPVTIGRWSRGGP